MKIYIAGKVSNDSHFGTHDWRDSFCADLEEISGLTLENLDPLKIQKDNATYRDIFAKDCYLISKSDLVLVYLSDDISVGGSQEILIAKYFKKPVIGLAPRGGKFNGSSRKIGGRIVKDHKDPFVFSTCDVVCDDIASAAKELVRFSKGNFSKVKTLDIISSEASRFEKMMSDSK